MSPPAVPTIRQRCQEYSARVDSRAALAKDCELLEGLR
jgi:hypothetical protein